MTGSKHAVAARLASSVTSQDDVGLNQDVPSPSKFALTWPAEPPPPVQAPLTGDHPLTLSSSEGESDLSEVEASSPVAKTSQIGVSEGSDITASHYRRTIQHFIVEHVDESPNLPRLSRAASLPLPSQLEHLQNPRRAMLTALEYPQISPQILWEPSKYQEFSLELADTVQMIVQTLLQVSPAQVLDPAKEQFSACSLSVPTSCMSAVFTTIKNLNYMSANMSVFCDEGNLTDEMKTGSPTLPCHSTNFDIGELLQGVGDALSGVAAHAGVDLVLFHGDVGMRHVAVKGDECGVSYVLSHVVRQVINCARKGDSIEIGLSIASSSDYITPAANLEHPILSEGVAPPQSISEDELLRFVFEINHNFVLPVTDEIQDRSQVAAADRSKPTFESMLLRRLLGRIGGVLNKEVEELKSSHPGQTFEIAIPLERGSLSAKLTPAIDDTSSLISGVHIASEPSLKELTRFADTLRGKKATLYACARSSFAHHLTSYLTAWGLDVSHVSSESADVESNPGRSASVTPSPDSESRAQGGFPLRSRQHGAILEDVQELSEQLDARPPTNGDVRSHNSISFDFIDDDVTVLRERLRKYRSDHTSSAVPHPRKRPSFHHRPRSSPHVTRSLGLPTAALPTTPTSVVVVHFTSLSNYKTVKDIVQRDLASHAPSNALLPEIMIIPKPAGPRRFLTALHTAVTKPIVDPFFVPIATSPMSPGLHGASPYFNTPLQDSAPKSPGSRPASTPRNNSDRSVRSPKEGLTEAHHLLPPSPLGMSDNIEYFPETAVKLGASPSSGLVIQSPDGHPAGIFFHPRAKNAKSVPSEGSMERDKGHQFLIPADRTRAPARRSSSDTDEPVSFSSLRTTLTPPTFPRVEKPNEGPASLTISLKGKGKKPMSPSKEEPGAKSPVSPPSRRASPMETRKTSTPPGSPPHEVTANPTSRRQRRPYPDSHKPAPPSTLPAKAKGPADSNIIPPISVLIVDDNPINQTILSTFMKKKKIKYDVAKNGEEAVQKWHSGGFHLILMDIQMPIMDGIEATKEIRRLENLTAAFGDAPATPQSEPSVRTPSEAASTESRNSASQYRSSVIIVALTASSLQSDRVAALAAGCNDFLTKPVSLQWLNNKIIEWGSIKALQMWADLRPEVVKTLSTEQAAQAQNVARRLHVPEGRITPVHSMSRSPSGVRKNTSPEDAAQAIYKLADDSSPNPSGEAPQVNRTIGSDGTSQGSTSSALALAMKPAPPIMEAHADITQLWKPGADITPSSSYTDVSGESNQDEESPEVSFPPITSDDLTPMTTQ